MATAKTVKSKKQEPPQDNFLLASFAHFSILTVLLLGPFSIVIPLIIWLMERNKPDKSSFVEFQAKQAFFFQLILYLATFALGVVVAILSIILIGILLIPFLLLFPLAGVVYGIIGGVRVSQGENFRYFWVADFIEAGRKKS
ncbi:MAG: DUF4870 domain-containing protein [bacterium]